MTTAEQLSRRTAIMAVGTVLSRVTGLGRVLALAYVLGMSRLTDTYNLANTTPNIIYELVLGGILSATLVPVFVSRLTTTAGEGDEEPAWREISALVSLAAVVLTVVTVAFALAAPWIIGLYTVGNDAASVPDQRAVATTLLRLFAPQVALYGLISVTTALLQARRRFAAPMFAPVLNNLVVIAMLLSLPRGLALAEARGDQSTLLLLGLGTTAGVLVQAVAQAVALRRAGTGLRWVWDPGAETVRRVLRLSGWTVGFVVANQLALYVVLVLANRDSGAVSAYQAAQIFFVLPHAIFTVSIISALLPDLSARWATGDVARFRSDLSVGLRMTAMVLLPAAAGYLVLARPIIDLVLEHGALSAASASTTAGVLACFAAGLPGFSAFLLLTRAFQAMEDTRTVFWLYVIENAINIVLAVALFPAFGVQGLAASYAIAYTTAAVMAGVVLSRRTQGIGGAALGVVLAKAGAAAAVMGAAVALVSRALGGDEGMALVLRVGGSVGAGVSVYLLAARAMRLRELTTLLRIGRRPA